jgi:2-keto-4-pentenoate hydratase/2-oxohepta-3-ene-1,7-dioic acid hydratase in catechol pathway
MRLISFKHGETASFGVMTDHGVVDAVRHLNGELRSLRHALATGAVDRLRQLAALTPDFDVDEIRFLPVIPDPAAKILCVGVNYVPHIREMGREQPAHPVIFVRFADSLVGHREPLVRPRASEQYDFEGELAVVIGRQARHVAAADALDYVAGFSCFNDGSVRDFQRHGLQWTPGKNFHHSGAFGPWLVTTDACGDPREFVLRTVLNGSVVQQESVGELCFGIGKLIEYCSTWTELVPGDVIATGTPGGVGASRNPPLWMKAGDTVDVDIAGVGVLRNPVVDEDDG